MELAILISMTIASLSFVSCCVIITLMAMGVGTEMKVVDINTVKTEETSIDFAGAFKKGALLNQPWMKLIN